MIELGLEEFVDGLLARHPEHAVLDTVRRARAKGELLAIADKAVDVAIMREVFRQVMNRLMTKAAMDKVHDLMQAGS